MKRYLVLALALLSVPSAHAVSYTAYQNFCQMGGKTVATSGITSKTKVQASYPLCTVSVYAVGTATLVTIYADALGNTKTNPFTANADGSFLFYADADIYPLDVTISAAGISPPFTYKAVLGKAGGGTSGCDPDNTVCSTNGLVGDVVFVGGANTTIVPSGNTLTISSSGGGGGSGPALQYQSAYFDTTTSIKGTQMGLPVASFGAVCDGTTDDHDAIQAAFNYAYDHIVTLPSGPQRSLFSVEFPSGVCYTATPIEYRGEAFSGVNRLSIIKGGPHQDVFSTPDPADLPTRTCCFQYNWVSDITVAVDASSDANGTALWAAKQRGGGQGSVFSNTFAGWSGQTIKGSVNSSATTIPLTTAVDLTAYRTNGYAPWGWIKVGTEFIHYQGITTSGCPNSSPLCLLNATRGITLAGTTSVAASHSDGNSVGPVNPLAPADITDWIPAWTVGACGFAFNARDGNHPATSMQHGGFRNVNINTYNAVTDISNETCSFFFQPGFYAGTISGSKINGTMFGIMIAPAFINQDYPLSHAASSDNMTFENIESGATVPFVSYIGGVSIISNLTDYVNGQTGYQATGLTLYSMPCHSGAGGCQASEMGGFHIPSIYQESNDGGGKVTASAPLSQLDGVTSISGFMGTFEAQNLAPILWGSRGANSTVDFGYGAHPALIVSGNENNFRNIGTGLIGAGEIIDTGYGNVMTSVSSQYGNRPINSVPARGAANQLAPDFLARGAVNGDWFQALQDLFLTPDDLNNNPAIQTTGASVVNDSTVPVTGRYIPIPSPGTIANTVGVDGVGMVIGQRFPKGTGTFYIALKAGAGTTQVWTLQCQSGSIGSATLTLTTTWAVYPIRYNSNTGACPLGGSGGWATAAATSATTTIQVGWEAFVPDFDKVTVAGVLNQALSTPASSGAACTTGDWAHDTGFIYTCTAPNTWERVPISTW